MKTEITDKDLDRLFEKIVEQPPLIDDIKVHTLLYNSPKSAAPEGTFNHFIHSHLNFIIMSTLISSILVGTILWFQPKVQPSQVNDQRVITTDSINRQTIEVKPKTAKKKHSVNQANEVLVAKSSIVQVVDTVSAPKVSAVSVPVKSSISDIKAVSGESYILDLSDEELKKLGVLNTDSGLYYLNINPEGMLSEYFRPYNIQSTRMNKQTKKTDVVTLRIGNNENVISFHSFYVYYSTNEQIMNETSNRITLSVYNELKGNYPGNQAAGSLILRNNQPDWTKNFFVKLDSINKLEKPVFLENFKTKSIKSIDDTLVPVLVHLRKSDLFAEKLKILWFVSNADFYNALPERLRVDTRSFFERQKQLKKNYNIYNTVDYNTVYEYFDYLDNQVNYVDLTQDELRKIGIWLKRDTIRNKSWLVYKDKRRSLMWNKDYTMTSSKKDTTPLELYAPYYSYFDRKVLLKTRIKGNNEAPKMNELIPIRVKKELFSECNLKDDIIFWYAVTEAFLDSLPPRVGDELKQDYQTIMIRRDPKVTVEAKTKLKSSCKYFEECKASLFDVNFTISPNPVTDNLNIDLQIQKAEKISITVYSITGRKIQTLMPFTQMETGSQRLSFPASNLPDGFLCISVQNSNGLNKTQRIIKLGGN